MAITRQNWLAWGITIFIPLLIIGLSILLFVTERRQSIVLANEVQALETVLRINRATVIMDRQRLAVAQSIYLPLNHTAIRDRAVEFHILFANPNLFTRAQSQQIQQNILIKYRAFIHLSLALPSTPTVAQVQAVQEQATDVDEQLDALERLYTADVTAIFQGEREQNRASYLVLLVANFSVLSLVILAFVLFVRVTQQRTIAATLRATDQLRNEFVAFTAHELRNPAGAIKTGASMLREPDLEPDIRAQVVESINRSADALTRLVLNLLAMGRLEEGRLQLERRPVGLPELVDELVAELEAYHPGVEKRIVRELPPVQVNVDPEYLKLAFSNILDNALKYAPPRSVITMTGEQEGDTVVTHVDNEGPPIPPDVLPHIFEKYETTGAAPQSTRRGVGLGLYMTRLLIEAHGGRVWAESAPGMGTTISVMLPVASVRDHQV